MKALAKRNNSPARRTTEVVPSPTSSSWDYAISTRGGVSKEAVNAELMFHNLPGVFCAGEMLDWTAPTGGGLLTGCFSTGSHVGKSVAKYLNLKLLN